MGRHRREPVGRRRAHRDPRRHPVVRPPLRRLRRRGVRQERPRRPRRAARRRRRQPHHPDQAELPGRAPDGRERAVRRGGARRLAGDPVAGVQDGARGVRAVRRRRGHAVRVRGGGRRDRGVLRAQRLAAGRRRDVRGAAAAGEAVRQGASPGAHGLPLGHAPARAGAGAAAGRAAGGESPASASERQCGSDKSQELLVVSVSLARMANSWLDLCCTYD